MSFALTAYLFSTVVWTNWSYALSLWKMKKAKGQYDAAPCQPLT